MKYLVVPDFPQKLLAAPEDARTSVVSMLADIEAHGKEELLGLSSVSPLTIDASLFVMRKGKVRIVFSLTESEGEDAALLADVLWEQAETSEKLQSRRYAKRDPRRDSRFNPIRNSAINPRRNTKLNPRWNSKINPRFNSRINPRFNSTLNPRFNSHLNPRFNSRLNPRHNSQLNPRLNWSINIARNPAFGGPFLYNLDLATEGYVVRIDDDTMAIFDMKAEMTGFAARSEAGYVAYNMSLEWTENWVDDTQGGYLRFNFSNEWIGFIA